MVHRERDCSSLEGEAVTVDIWAAWEDSYEDPEVIKLDLIRIRAYALACADSAVKAREALAKAVDAMVRSRAKAERELVRCKRVCDLAERAATFAARAMAGDVAAETRREAALALEDLFQ